MPNVDIFPADAVGPIRVAGEDGSMVSLCRYDPVTQRGDTDLDEVTIGRAAEPVVRDGVALLDHVPDAVVAMDGDVPTRRARFLDLAKDATRRRRRDAAALIDGKAWDTLLGEREHIDRRRDAKAAAHVAGVRPAGRGLRDQRATSTCAGRAIRLVRRRPDT